MVSMIIAFCVFLLGFGVSGAVVLWVRRLVDIAKLRASAETVRYHLSIILGLYGIFAGFTIASLWDQQRQAERNVLLEASELRTIFRLAGALPESPGLEIQQAAIFYAKNVAEKEWKQLLEGAEYINHIHLEKDRIWDALKSYEPRGDREGRLLQSLLGHFETLSEARRCRVYDAQRSLPPYLWMILIMGSALSILCTLLLGSENIRLHALLTGLAGGFICLMLFVVYDLQNPFRGYWVITPQAFTLAQDRMSRAGVQGAPGMDPSQAEDTGRPLQRPAEDSRAQPH